jgi:hypothetical protein
VLATLMRPSAGGWRIGSAARKVLSWVFGGVAPVLAAPDVAVHGAVHGRRARLRDADGTGQRRRLQAGAGALPERHRHGDRPRRRPRRPGRVLPPLLLGVFHDRLGASGPDSCCCPRPRWRCRAANQRVFRPGDVAWTQSLPVGRASSARAVRAGAWAALVTATLAAAIVVGSRNLQHFDAALVGYTFATLFAAFGISYRYAMWLQRPPTRMYWRRGWQAFFSRRALAGNTVSLGRRALLEFAGQRVHLPARPARGLAHWLIMWGCLLAAAITFPLVWGWIHFETVPGDLHMYRTFVFGIPMQDFPVESPSPSSSSTGSCGRRSWSSPA